MHNIWVNVFAQECSLSVQEIFFYWSMVIRHPLLSMWPNSRLLERKKVFSINDIICTNRIGTANHSSIREQFKRYINFTLLV